MCIRVVLYKQPQDVIDTSHHESTDRFCSITDSFPRAIPPQFEKTPFHYLVPTMSRILSRLFYRLGLSPQNHGPKQTRMSPPPLNQAIPPPAAPFDHDSTGRFVCQNDTLGIVTRFTEAHAASRFTVDGEGDVFLSIEGRIGNDSSRVCMRTYDGFELFRLYPAHDRQSKAVHIFDCREFCNLIICDAGMRVRRGYSTIFVWKAEDECGEPVLAIHVGKYENYAIVEELSSGRNLATIDNRLAKVRSRLSGHTSKSVHVMGDADMALMTMLAACLDDICLETLGRNLKSASKRKSKAT